MFVVRKRSEKQKSTEYLSLIEPEDRFRRGERRKWGVFLSHLPFIFLMADYGRFTSHLTFFDDLL